jgi:hypothetical protein
VATASKLEQIGKWLKLLTMIALAVGVLLGAMAVYQSLNSTGTPGV